MEARRIVIVGHKQLRQVHGTQHLAPDAVRRRENDLGQFVAVARDGFPAHFPLGLIRECLDDLVLRCATERFGGHGVHALHRQPGKGQ